MAELIKSQKRGTQYADNIISDELTFNNVDTDVWTISSGTGTVTLDKTLSFEGKGSLKIDNTDVSSDITVTNSTQSTTIPRTGVYDMSLYLYKTEALTEITGLVNIFKNAVLLDTQAFSIGSTDSSFDINNQWVSFFSNSNYSLNASDVITFTFTIDGQVSGLTDLQLWIDGVMFYNKERLQIGAPIYSTPVINLDDLGILSSRITVNNSNVGVTLGGVIDSTKEYFIDGEVDMSSVSIQVPVDGINITGLNFNLSKLINSDNSYTMFYSGVSGSGNIFIKNTSIEVSGVGSSVYNVVGATGGEALEIISVNYENCTSLGVVDNYRQGFESETGRFGGMPQLELKGVWSGGYAAINTITRGLADGAYTLFKAGAGFSMSSRFRTNMNVDLPASASLLDFSESNFVNSSNIQLSNCIITRNGVFNPSDANITPNITASNIKSLFTNNQGIINTYVGGQTLVTTEAVTTITTSGQFEDLNGTFTASDLQHFDSPSNGHLRHLGESPVEYKITINAIIDASSGDEIDLKIVVWDDSASSFVDYKIIRRVVNNLQGARDVAYFNMIDFIILDSNDYVKTQGANVNSTNDITMELNSEIIVEKR